MRALHIRNLHPVMRPRVRPTFVHCVFILFISYSLTRLLGLTGLRCYTKQAVLTCAYVPSLVQAHPSSHLLV